MDISVQTNLRQIQRQFGAFAEKQIPFATAMALTGIGKRVQVDEKKQFSHVLDRPTPFTLNAVSVRAARKSDLRAVVYVKDKAAGYLAPYESGDVQKVNGRAVLNPKASSVNQYGNLPRNLIARLKGRSDVFIGPIKTKGGEVINGVWQRPYMRGGTGKVRGNSKLGRGFNTSGALKLLVRFTDPQPTTKRLGYRTTAKASIDRHFKAEFTLALSRAMATAH